MARKSYKSTMLFNFLLLFLIMEESRIVSSGIETNSALICSKVYGANIGDTCFTFATFNPNLNCDKMLVSEWICLDGSSV
ncbi:unnamed protein product [Withania somnifera]